MILINFTFFSSENHIIHQDIIYKSTIFCCLNTNRYLMLFLLLKKAAIDKEHAARKETCNVAANFQGMRYASANWNLVRVFMT